MEHTLPRARRSRTRARTPYRPRTRTRAERFVAGDAALVGIFGLCLAFALLTLTLQPAPPAAGSWTTVSIRQHSTLWDIARAHPVPGLTTAETVDLIRTHNSLEAPDLIAGQPLLVPASDRFDTPLGRR